MDCRTTVRSASLAQIAEDLGAVADAYGLDRFAIIGVSGGAPFAVAAAASMPDRISLLALVCPVGEMVERPTSTVQISEISVQAAGAKAMGNAALLPSLAHHGVQIAGECLSLADGPRARAGPGAVGAAEVRASLQAAMGEGLRPGAEGAAQDLRLYCAPWGLRLADIDVPAIVWQGSDDPVVPPAAAYALARALPNCRLDVIQGAGHYWVLGPVRTDPRCGGRGAPRRRCGERRPAGGGIE